MKHKLLSVAIVTLASMTLAATPVHAKKNSSSVRGLITALSDSEITVGSLTCAVSSSSLFKGKSNRALAISEFDVGDLVRLRCRNGAASEIKMENNQADDGVPTADLTLSPAKLRAQLLPSEGSLANGRLDYHRKDFRADSRFHGSIKIPLPSTIPLATAESISGLILKVNLKRGTDPAFAQCNLVFDKIATVDEKQVATFKLDIHRRRGVIRNRKGSCDADLVTDGVQDGFPVVLKGDSLVINDSVTGDFMNGNFHSQK